MNKTTQSSKEGGAVEFAAGGFRYIPAVFQYSVGVTASAGFSIRQKRHLVRMVDSPNKWLKDHNNLSRKAFCAGPFYAAYVAKFYCVFSMALTCPEILDATQSRHGYATRRGRDRHRWRHGGRRRAPDLCRKQGGRTRGARAGHGPGDSLRYDVGSSARVDCPRLLDHR